mgnify:CR=1 FL=1
MEILFENWRKYLKEQISLQDFKFTAVNKIDRAGKVIVRHIQKYRSDEEYKKWKIWAAILEGDVQISKTNSHIKAGLESIKKQNDEKINAKIKDYVNDVQQSYFNPNNPSDHGLNEKQALKYTNILKKKGFVQDSKGIFHSPLRQVIAIKYVKEK